MPSSAADSTADQSPRVEVLRDLDGGANAWLLMVDGVPQSHVDLDDPKEIGFEYVRRLAHVADLLAPAGEPVDALHLGAGALTLARYIAATRPESRQRAVDIDADLVELVRARLPWDTRVRIRVGIGEARAWLEQRREASADLVVTDVYVGARAPANVTTVEFVCVASTVVRPGGVFAVNVGDGGSLAHVRRQIATLREVFGPDNLAAIAEPSVWRGRRFGNFVLLASHRALPLNELSRRAHRDPDMARLVSGRKLNRFAAVARPARDATAEDSPVPPRDVFSR